jgi:biopolymer transport protein ExbD
MKIEPKYGDEEFEVDMSPMIDMVFLLLIFFIVASTIIDEKVKVDIPMAVYAKIPESTTGRVVISVNKDDEIFYGPMPVTLNELEDSLLWEVERYPDVRVLIRSGKKVKYKTNEKIMMACAKVGASDLIFSAFEE